ncbi:MAG: isoprenyl transferase [Clostridia bacterium]|nr:isoprenyl transferase [Clostridia bacterium]
MAAETKFSVLPRHIGIIMDGNGRWAKKRGLPRTAGHKKGADVFRDITTYCSELGIEAVTFYAFSTENWRRPPEEVNTLMDLFREYFEELERRERENEKMGFRIRFIGDISGLPADIAALAAETERRSNSETRTTVNIAVNYGGRQEIVHAAQLLAQQVQSGALAPEDITEDLFAKHIYTGDLPDPDVIIRPGGEMRLSNFMTWQSAYSEFWFSDVLWPDFTRATLDEVFADFDKRNRRFGGV